MKRFIVCLFTILMVFTIVSSNETSKSQSKSPILNQYVEEMVASIEEDEAESLLRTLTYDFGTRNARLPGNVQACEWARDKFKEWGIDSVYLDKFSASYGPNVVAVKYGEKQNQDSIIITGGHIDCMPNADFSPGADDNGSGTINVMYTAKAMSTFKFRNEVRYILFNAEDYGLIGSKSYVNDHKNDEIAAVTIHDMCLWFKQGDTDFDLETQSYNQSLGDFFVEVGEDYTTLDIKRISPSY